MNDTFLMPQGEEMIYESQYLGQFIKCIRNKPEAPPWKLIDTFLVSIIAFALFVAITTSSLVVRVLSYSAMLTLLLPFGMFKTIKYAFYFMKRDYVFFYEKGFVWEVRSRSGKVVDRKEVLYADIDHMDVEERRIQGNSSYSSTEIKYKLTLVSHDGNVLFTKSSKYYRKVFSSKDEHVARSAAMKEIQQQMEVLKPNRDVKATGSISTSAPKTENTTVPKATGSISPKATNYDNKILQPWYTTQAMPEPKTAIGAAFQGVDWLRTITRAARYSLHNGQPYADAKSREWFESQSAKGLRDVYYFYDEWAKAPLQPGDKHGIICWYASSNPCYFTFSVDDKARLSLVEKSLTENLYQKPVLKDNTQEFVSILTKMASYYEGTWGEKFLQAAQKAREGNLMEAVALSQTGGGIGSIYDMPYFDRNLTDKLFDERHHALLYSVNYCK